MLTAVRTSYLDDYGADRSSKLVMTRRWRELHVGHEATKFRGADSSK